MAWRASARIITTPLRYSPSQQAQPFLRFSQSYSSTELTMKKDWSSEQYLKFNAERTRPARDLLSQVQLHSPRRVVDLGCGPGNSTEVLVERFPEAEVLGVDSSPDMIAKAKSTLPQLEFLLQDLVTYKPTEAVDLFFCNAVLQWLPPVQRISITTTLIQSQPPGGVFAFQVPDNLAEPSHTSMRAVAEREPFAGLLREHQPVRSQIETPQQLYDQLGPYCSSINVWQTRYQHVLDSHEEIAEWVKGTGLRPFVDPLPERERRAFLDQYLGELKAVYPLSSDGKVLFPFPRLFVVAVRK
ncbi:S-adenosyl-L-methionine-dependent methyltransferase [Phialemonium atrogriseum]|uniref:S-adenosyl-L-methionine-dependent methyltransferase n=1 Tax=Phialemonium atrogriseum TaxID=1093897 RepID=A0AAJ0FIT8_9PEZI|nr:S-adenosyl-L-methionine-dependent methyltransferase [Phialemonium atrogriseum]KAK1762420.1 S-adenosyl-L-methionine-dependent methyltransferase [Phialemonium atrogriseum]